VMRQRREARAEGAESPGADDANPPSSSA